MLPKEWIKQAERAGWRLDQAKGLTIGLRCSKEGCSGALVLPRDNLGPIPEPCALNHIGPYSESLIGDYNGLVDSLRRRRRALGMSQEDVTAASGLGDGHINKLENLDRIGGFPTMQLWAQTLGLSLSLEPAPMPPKTLGIIQERAAAPYQENMARFKQQQLRLTDGR